MKYKLKQLLKLLYQFLKDVKDLFSKKSYPKVLYKYKSWRSKRDEESLINNILYLTPPEKFNDPFDCRITSNFVSLSNREVKKYAELLVSKNADEILKLGEDLEYHKDYILNKLKDRKKHQLDYDKQSFGNLNKHSGVVSLTERWDSILMWSHYADCHKGICIGFKEEYLRESRKFGLGGRVSYVDEMPSNNPIESILKANDIRSSIKVTHSKAKDWSYEKEYRMTKFLFPEPLVDRSVILPNEAIEEVIIGLSSGEDDTKDIINICKMKNVPVYKIIRTPFSFVLKRERII